MASERMALAARQSRRFLLRSSLVWVIAAFVSTSACGEDPELGGARGRGIGRGGSAAKGGSVGTAGTADGSAGDDAGGDDSSVGGSSTGGSTASGGSAGTAAGSGNGGSAQCGNGTPDQGEECDDGNTVSGDGCSSACTAKCETCERTKCIAGAPEWDPEASFDPSGCYNLTGVAARGPAANAPRKELCVALLDCMKRTRCGGFSIVDSVTEFDPIPCYCTGSSDDCLDGVDDAESGPCRTEIEEAVESTTAQFVLANIKVLDWAAGAATASIAGCGFVGCRAECLPGVSCPVVSTTTATPNPIPVGSLARVAVEATSPGGEILTYEWKDPSGVGEFTSPASAQSDFDCKDRSTAAGRTLTVEVRSPSCNVKLSLPVTCETGSGSGGSGGGTSCHSITSLTVVPDTIAPLNVAIATVVVDNPGGGQLGFAWSEEDGYGLFTPAVATQTATTAQTTYDCADRRPEIAARKIVIAVQKTGCNPKITRVPITCEVPGGTGGSGGGAGTGGSADGSTD